MKSSDTTIHTTLIPIGLTGVGKSTLLNGLVVGMNFDDENLPFKVSSDM